MTREIHSGDFLWPHLRDLLDGQLSSHSDGDLRVIPSDDHVGGPQRAGGGPAVIPAGPVPDFLVPWTDAEALQEPLGNGHSGGDVRAGVHDAVAQRQVAQKWRAIDRLHCFNQHQSLEQPCYAKPAEYTGVSESKHTTELH